MAPVVDLLGYDMSIDISEYTTQLSGTLPLPADGVLSSDAVFTFTANNAALEVEVAADPTNTSREDLRADIQAAVDPESESIRVNLVDDAVRFSIRSEVPFVISVAAALDNPAFTELGLGEEINLPYALLSGTSELPADGRLTADATFQLAVHGAAATTVVVPAAETSGHLRRQNLVDTVQDAILAAGITNVAAVLIDDRLVLETTESVESARLVVTANATDPAVTELGLPAAGDTQSTTSFSAAVADFTGTDLTCRTSTPTSQSDFRATTRPARFTTGWSTSTARPAT